ncbi:Alanine racemase, N-terminal domain [Algoriphagus alkaliphilus]|uniref:Alanine racemase, N-terminal domain n=1 Tax=Algoriphagus alkaliphilus TaxID=279824 RepID=A0A1G5UWP3_9BACT|nr:alanine racemase [Algoriphagus alkaliphilus]SDA37516.1 Alanine racemase, N-terminal domain [Algoriphagus alkaliphilus]
MLHTSCLEISTGAYFQNIEFIRSRIGTGPTISSVVKGNAYGHGIAQMVTIAEKAGIHHFSTFCSDEAWEVLENSSQKNEVMIMGVLHPEEIPDLIRNGIQFYAFGFERLEHAIETAKTLGLKAQIHVQVETGFEWAERKKLLKILH